jgi:two-component system response regulator PilR (NtrC family)
VNTNSAKLALIVDDEPDLCELAEITLSRMGLDTCTANDLTTAKSLLESQKIDICLTDMNLPDGNGIELVEHIQTAYAHIPVAVITAYGNMESAVRALKAGAFDFVSKPVDLQVLRNLVTSAVRLPGPVQEETSTQQLLGDSPAMNSLRKKIAKLARSQAPVFIHGESGCGKELVARMLHQLGSRCDQPFIPVNCGAIPVELMESELFGHKKGSFTGASADKDGLFKAAEGGTLFLDEVADLPFQMQVKLLRAIQEKAVRPVGDHREQPIDVRILSASHKNLEDLVQQGKFREDLYYRINVIELDVPSLRDHPQDIPLLARHLMQQLASKSGLTPAPELAQSSIEALSSYTFPGNVRELENVLERALALAENNLIQVEDLQLPNGQKSALTAPTAAVPVAKTALDLTNLADQEKAAILQALEQTRWNKTAAARILGLTLRQLRYRLEKLDID